VFIAVAVVAGIAIGLARGGRFSNLGEATFRVWPLLVAGVLVQAAAAFASPAAVTLILVSYATLLVFTAINFRQVGMGVVFIGIALNFIVIAANGGMPVRSDAIIRAGIAGRDDLRRLDFGSKRHLETSGDRVTFLSDIVPVPGATEVLSFGDLVMSVGVADVLVHLLRRRAVMPTAPGGPASPDTD